MFRAQFPWFIGVCLWATPTLDRVTRILVVILEDALGGPNLWTVHVNTWKPYLCDEFGENSAKWSISWKLHIISYNVVIKMLNTSLRLHNITKLVTGPNGAKLHTYCSVAHGGGIRWDGESLPPLTRPTTRMPGRGVAQPRTDVQITSCSPVDWRCILRYAADRSVVSSTAAARQVLFRCSNVAVEQPVAVVLSFVSKQTRKPIAKAAHGTI